MVVKYGGHALGLAVQMPAHEDVLTDEDVSNVVAFVKTLADTTGFPPGEMNLFLPIRTKKAFPEDEVVYHGRFTDQEGDNAYKNVLEFEKRIGKAGQLIFELVHESEGDVSELSEAEFGYKQALSFSRTHVLSAAWIFQSSLRFKFPFEGADLGEAELAGIVHYVHSPWPRRVFPALEMTMTAPYDSDNGDVGWTVMPQVRIGLTRGGHVALNLGAEFPLSDQAWDQRYYVTLLWGFADGGFFKGW